MVGWQLSAGGGRAASAAPRSCRVPPEQTRPLQPTPASALEGRRLACTQCAETPSAASAAHASRSTCSRRPEMTTPAAPCRPSCLQAHRRAEGGPESVRREQEEGHTGCLAERRQAASERAAAGGAAPTPPAPADLEAYAAPTACDDAHSAPQALWVERAHGGRRHAREEGGRRCCCC